MIKFPPIEQLRNVIRNVTHRARFVGVGEDGTPIYNPAAPLPTLKFRGTVKMHGTNAGIAFDCVTNEIVFQSRERELTIQSDNAGFALYMTSKEDVLKRMLAKIRAVYMFAWLEKTPQKIVIFGEYAGGNIQSGIALNGLPKMFVVFGVKAIYDQEDAEWLDLVHLKDIVRSPDDNIHCVLDFQNWEIDINFEHPEEIQNKIIELTMAVETKCPVGAAFGQDGIGEGLVFQCITPGYNDSGYWFKSKGEKHSASKVKTLAAVDVEAIRAVNDFVDATVTENRLVQGLQNLVREQQKPFEMTSMGDFIRWVFNDVVKEESDTLVASQLDPKKIGGPVATKARKWFIKKFNEGYVVDNT